MTLKTLTSPRLFAISLLMHCNRLFSDSLYLKLLFRLFMGYKLNLSDPKTFQEKLQWLKLYYRCPNHKKLVDKATVKEYVKKVLGEQYVIPTLATWEKPEDIEWDKLPKQFVLKTTHGGGSQGVVICKDKDTFDRQMAINKLKLGMKQDVWKSYREWPYKDLPKRIIAEQYIECSPEVDSLPDYKWYCFNGEPTYCQVIQDRGTNETIDFYDINWQRQEFTGLNPWVQHAAHPAPRPDDLETQIKIARVLSNQLPFARIDLYAVKGKTYFGEITFYPMSGTGSFRPNRYDKIIGEKLILPGRKNC